MNLNCPEYLKVAEDHLIKEEERALYYLQPETKVPLMTTVQTKIIEKNAPNLVETSHLLANGYDNFAPRHHSAR